MKTHAAVVRIRRQLNTILLAIGGTSLVLLMFLGFGDVFARYLFDASIVQREELFRLGLIIIFATSFPVITLRHENLDVDLLDNLFVGVARKIQFFLIDAAVAICCATMSYWMWDKSGRISRPGREVMFEELGLQQGWFAKGFAVMLAVVAVLVAVLAILHLLTIFFKQVDDDLQNIQHRETL